MYEQKLTKYNKYFFNVISFTMKKFFFYNKNYFTCI